MDNRKTRDVLLLGLVLGVGSVTWSGLAAQGPPGKPTVDELTFHRIQIPTGSPEHPFPYTLEVPEGWEMRREAEAPMLLFTPSPDAPEQDPRTVYVRISPVVMTDPEAMAQSIRANAARATDWSAPEVAVKEVGGVQGVLVRMERGEGEDRRVTLIFKLPLKNSTVDYMATAPAGEFEAWRPLYERVFFSIRQVDG